MNTRSIYKIIPAQKVNMGGIFLDQPLPAAGVDQVDPFILLHHWNKRIEGGDSQKNQGVGPHPHRGFSPVTLIFKGGVHHQDSRGNNSIIMEGGTQWMNSGMGIVHSERPTKELAEKGGIFEIIQFWVNAPAKNKMDQPSYQPLPKENTPTFKSEDKKIDIGVVAGEVNGLKGPIVTNSPLIVLRLTIEKGGKTTLPIPEHFNTILYQLDGSLNINDQNKTTAKDMVWFKNDGDNLLIEGLEETRAILLAGEPIREEITTYGPFVMNTQTEIMEAMKDYQMGKMGILIEEFES
ncbi:MAG: pirin family protein [Bacteroidetes bacterium]|nr:pirin family protein [Bacteroidota bacterium]